MIRRSLARAFALVLAVALGGCTTFMAEETARPAPVVAPEATILSDYQPAKAGVLPAIRALGYTPSRDADTVVVLSKPGQPPTRLTLTFASIRTHTRVIADLRYESPGDPAGAPAANHPDRERIQAALEEAKRAIEGRPASARAPMTAAAAPTAPLPAPAPPAVSTANPPPTSGTQPPPLVPGQTRARVEGGWQWPRLP